MQDSKLSGSHQVMEQADNMNMTVEMERYEQLGIDSSFTPKHWTDAKLFLGQTQTIDMQTAIQNRFNKLTEHARNIQKIKQHTPIDASGTGQDNASIMSGGNNT